jgi:hypothetical protein
MTKVQIKYLELAKKKRIRQANEAMRDRHYLRLTNVPMH